MDSGTRHAHQHAVLFLAALLMPRRDVDWRVRSEILAQARSLALHTRKGMTGSVAAVLDAAGLTRAPRGCPRSSAFERAEKLSETWLNRDIWPIEQGDVQAPCAWLHDLPPVWFAMGKRSLLDQPAAAILNSRKPRHIGPRDPWLLATKAMVRSALENHFAVVSGYGPPAHTVVSELARGSPTIIVCDDVLPFMASASSLSRFMAQWGDLFDMDHTLFVSAFPPGKRPSRSSRYVARDHLVTALASTIMVAEVRPKGNMESVLRIAAKRKIPIRPSPLHEGQPSLSTGCNVSVCTAEKKKKPVMLTGRRATMGRIEPAQFGSYSVRDARDLADRCSYLIHYTRSCVGPWPGQTNAEYSRALIEDRPGAAHTGFDSLLRILEQDTIRASPRLVRGNTPVICFTELLPKDLQELTAWRPGLLRWSFEPYGIALKKERLFSMGARPVIYAVEEFFRDLSDDLKYLFQIHRTQGTHWSAEREWRMKGDLTLSTFTAEEVFLIVPRPEEAETLINRFGLKVGLARLAPWQS